MKSKEFGDTSLKCQSNDQIEVSRRQLFRNLGFRGESQRRDCSVRTRAWLRLPVLMGETRRNPLHSLCGAEGRPGREAWLRVSGSWAKQRQCSRHVYQLSAPVSKLPLLSFPLTSGTAEGKGLVWALGDKKQAAGVTQLPSPALHSGQLRPG